MRTSRAPDYETLDLYCDRVASAVGRLSVRVFGVPRERGQGLAHHLGRAFQLTNILRDLDEDAEINRLYLPREALEAAGIATTVPAQVLAEPGLAKACAPIIALAKSYFAEAQRNHGALPAQKRAGATADGRRLSFHSGRRRSARLRVSARQGSCAEVIACWLRSCATACFRAGR